MPGLVSECDSLTIDAKIALTLGAGTIKAEDCSYIDVEGPLVGSGTTERDRDRDRLRGLGRGDGGT